MIDEPLQMQLFASSESRSSSAEPSSPRSNDPTTSSREPSPSSPTSAIDGSPTPPVAGQHSRVGALAAERRSASARDTAESGQLVISTATTSRKHTADPMFEIPKPKTRAECKEEARPCPWVSCKYHLLIEVMQASEGAEDARVPKLRLNRPSSGKTASHGGRRAGLAASAAAEIVRDWIDEAVEALSYMPYTCALDVVEDYPDGLNGRRVGWLLGVTRQMIDEEGRKPRVIDAIEQLREFREK